EKRLGFRKRLYSVERLSAKAAGPREANKKPFMAVGAGNFPRAFLDHVFDPHLFQLRVLRTARQHGRDWLRKRLGKKKVKLTHEAFERRAIQLSSFNHLDDRMILRVFVAHHRGDFFDELWAGNWHPFVPFREFSLSNTAFTKPRQRGLK